MPLKKYACANHPQRMTTRRCYYCKKPICSPCQLKLGGHIFCSRTCYYKWRVKQWMEFPAIQQLRENTLLWTGLLTLWLYVLFFLPGNDKPAYQQKSPLPKPVSSTIPAVDTLTLWPKPFFQVSLNANSAGVLLIEHDSAYSIVQTKEHQRQFLLRPGENSFVFWYLRPGRVPLKVDSFSVVLHSESVLRRAQPLEQIAGVGKVVALTFDGGWSNKGTDTLLTILRQKKVKATLFLTGLFIKKYPHLVLRMIREGHQIGNHTYSHPHLTTFEENYRHNTLSTVNRYFIYQQLLKNDSLLYALTGKHFTPFWRAPYGEWNREIVTWAAEVGFRHVGWTPACDTRDWVADTLSPLYQSPQEILQHLLSVESKNGLAGKIILMHLASERKKAQPFNMLSDLIDSIRSRGYVFKTINQMVEIASKSKE